MQFPEFTAGVFVFAMEYTFLYSHHCNCIWTKRRKNNLIDLYTSPGIQGNLGCNLIAWTFASIILVKNYGMGSNKIIIK